MIRREVVPPHSPQLNGLVERGIAMLEATVFAARPSSGEEPLLVRAGEYSPGYGRVVGRSAPLVVPFVEHDRNNH